MQQRLRGIEETQCRIEMARQGLSVGALAQRAKLNPRILTNVLCGSNRVWPPRRAINIALKKKIFSKPARVRRSRKPQSP